MLRLDTINQAAGDLSIYIDDTSVQWRTGQVVRLTFNNVPLLGSRNIKIYTDAPSRLNTGRFGKLAVTIPNSKLSELPIIDLVCLEQGVLNFAYDCIK
jgi:hypothetical protein